VKHVRAVLFDAGGTLIHVDGERICRAAGVGFDDDGFRRAESAAIAAVRAFVLEKPDSRDSERIPLYFDTLLSGLGVADAAERRRGAGAVVAEHQRQNLWSRRADRALETLEALRGRGYRMAVISNADGRVRRLLEEAGLTGHLEFVIDSAEVGIEKPDPRIFRTATDRLGLPPSACAYVGDIYEIDVIGALGASLEPVLIGDGPAPPGTRRVADFDELLTLLPGFA
jgi:HAD superfamily hydrolase (TIGR01509 family)